MGQDDASAVFSGPTVPVALVRGQGDPDLRVPVYVGDELRALARLDLSPGAPLRIGELLRIRAGLPEPRRGRVALPTVKLGDLTVVGLVAEEVPGEDLVLSLAALPDVAVWVRPTDGVVEWMPPLAARERLPGAGTIERWSLPAGPAELVWADVLVDPTSGLMATRPAHHPTWTDADRWLGSHLRDDALFGGVVEGPDFLDALRWGRAAPHLFAAGELEQLAEADANLLVAAADDCVALLGVAERATRTAAATLLPARGEAAAAWGAWRSLEPGEREALRAAGEGVDDRCATIGRFAGGEPWDPVDPWPTARLAWTTGDAVAARFALEHGADAPALHLVLLDHLRRTSAPDDAVSAAASALRGDGPHPLARALALADRLELAPTTLAERVAAGLPADADALETLLVERPGDAAVTCLAAAADPDRAVPPLPEADCLAADALRARRAGDPAREQQARAALAQRWPDVWRDDPNPRGVRTLRSGGPP